MAKLITKTYGDALFDVAVEAKAVDLVESEAASVTEIFVRNPELLKLLNHPNVTKEEKNQVIEQVFASRVSGEMYFSLSNNLLIRTDSSSVKTTISVE